MLMSSRIKGMLEFTRGGLAHTVVLPASLEKRMSYDMDIDNKSGVITFTEGETVYIIADEFGVKEETKVNLFFVNGAVVMELTCGLIYLKGENGVIYTVNETEEINYVKDDPKVIWVTAERLHDLAKIVTTNRYALPDEATIEAYVANLAYTVILENQVWKNMSDCFRARFVDYFLDLGLDRFIFVSYADESLTKADRELDDENYIDLTDEPEEIEIDNAGYEGFFDAEDDEDAVIPEGYSVVDVDEESNSKVAM